MSTVKLSRATLVAQRPRPSPLASITKPLPVSITFSTRFRQRVAGSLLRLPVRPLKLIDLDLSRDVPLVRTVGAVRAADNGADGAQGQAGLVDDSAQRLPQFEKRTGRASSQKQLETKLPVEAAP